jgi:hypothetical protein
VEQSPLSRGPAAQRRLTAAAVRPLRDLVASLAILALAANSGCFSAAASSNTAEEQIVIPVGDNPDKATQIDLGDMDASRRIERSVLLKNISISPVSIDRVDANCECVTIVGALVTIQPHQTASVKLAVDLRDDLEFKGSLGVPTTGFDQGGRPVFSAVIRTRVGLQP